ncbi:type VII toxin-antitoxin system MntA family adenylyltransferase antitoxin [Methylomonas paludis]|nr:nucleotidyltransferase domain-containing protein [Methylomonas paludis]
MLNQTGLANAGSIVTTMRAAFPTSLAIYAFGSRIKGTANADSDLDLAVLVAGYVEPLQLWELSGTLADIAACPVDLLDMRAASTVMQFQILEYGQRLWGQEPQAGLFECFILSEKTSLDSARASLLTDIQAQGSVYGR